MAKKKRTRTRAQTERRQVRRQAAFSGAVGALSGAAGGATYSKLAHGRVKPLIVAGSAATSGYLNARGGVNSVKRAQGKKVPTRGQRVAAGGRSRQRRDKRGRFA